MRISDQLRNAVQGIESRSDTDINNADLIALNTGIKETLANMKIVQYNNIPTLPAIFLESSAGRALQDYNNLIEKVMWLSLENTELKKENKDLLQKIEDSKKLSLLPAIRTTIDKLDNLCHAILMESTGVICKPE